MCFEADQYPILLYSELLKLILMDESDVWMYFYEAGKQVQMQNRLLNLISADTNSRSIPVVLCVILWILLMHLAVNSIQRISQEPEDINV